MRDSKLVSVIIPCYMQGRFLNECIGSLVKQTYSHWEAIIINDGSNDETDRIASQLVKKDSRIRYYIKANEGPSAARNYGLKKAQGEFIQFLDADDTIASKKFETQINYLTKEPSIEIVYGNAKYYDDSGHEGYRRSPNPGDQVDWISDMWKRPEPILNKLLKHNLFPICCPLIRMRALEAVGNFNQSLQLYEDWELWVRCAVKNVSIHYLDDIDTECMIRTHALSATQDLTRMEKDLFLFYCSCLKYMPDIKQNVRRLILIRLIFASALNEYRDIGHRYNIIHNYQYSYTEKGLIRLGYFLEITGLLQTIAIIMNRHIPLWIRRRL